MVQLEESLFTEAVQNLVFILEIVVDGAGRILDFVCDLPHGDGVVTVAHEQLASGVKNLPLQLLGLTRPAFCHSHMHTVQMMNAVQELQ